MGEGAIGRVSQKVKIRCPEVLMEFETVKAVLHFRFYIIEVRP